jgi:hypothetical protein
MNTPAYANAAVSLTNKNNQIIHQQNYSFSGQNTSGSVSDKFLLPSSMNQSLLGMGRITGSASGTNSSIEGAWATMIYTADPCVANPLYSPDCKGYAIAIAKKLAPPTSSTATTDGTQTTDMDTATGMLVSDPTRPPPPPGSQPPPPPGSEPPPGSQPPPPGTTQTASSNPSSTPANQPPPQGSSQPKAGEVKTAGDSNSKAGPSLSSVLSMISSNQARIGNEARSVVQAAESAAAKDAQQAQQQAETVASVAVSQSTASNTTGTSASSGTTASTSAQTQTSAGTLQAGASSTLSSIEAIRPPTQVTATETTQSMGTGLTVPTMSYQFNSTATQSMGTFSVVESPLSNFGFQLPSGRFNTQIEPELTPQTEGIKMGSRSPLNDIIEQRPMLQNATTQEQRTDAVNKNAQPNELAGRVDIASMATQPAGYQAYSMMIPDVAFYAPREIYRNQVNVDNARLLRGLGSDRLHQEMVNQQYRPRN